jgi:hypothetical protein
VIHFNKKIWGKQTMRENEQILIAQNDHFVKDDTDKLIYALQQHNLVYNYNFLYFSNQFIDPRTREVIYKHPDGWIYNDDGNGAQISLDGESCRIVTSHDKNPTMTFKQALHEFPRWKSMLLGKPVTAKVHLSLSKNCDLSVTLSDGIASSCKHFQGEEAGDYIVELHLDINATAEKLYIEIKSISISAVIKITKVYANLGTIAIENLPCIVNGFIGERKQYISTEIPPATELSLCEESVELSDSYSRLSSVLNNKFGAGKNGNSLLPDMRGYFSRAWDNGSTIDPDAEKRTILGKGNVKGDHVGTVEKDQYEQHDHQLKFNINGQVYGGSSAALTIINITSGSKTEKSGGAETRGKNIAELYTIKWS